MKKRKGTGQQLALEFPPESIRHPILRAAHENAGKFTAEFLTFIESNLHIYDAFEREAKKTIAKGFTHYSARTIIEVLRHHSALKEVGGAWKLNDHTTPYLSRLFAIMNPASADLFEYRKTKAESSGVAR